MMMALLTAQYVIINHLIVSLISPQKITDRKTIFKLIVIAVIEIAMIITVGITEV